MVFLKYVFISILISFKILQNAKHLNCKNYEAKYQLIHDVQYPIKEFRDVADVHGHRNNVSPLASLRNHKCCAPFCYYTMGLRFKSSKS